MLFSRLEWLAIIFIPPLILVLLAYLQEKEFFQEKEDKSKNKKTKELKQKPRRKRK